MCRAYEMYGSLVPHSALTFEHVVLIVVAVAQGSDVSVALCESCHAVILADGAGYGRWHCLHCGSHSATLTSDP